MPSLVDIVPLPGLPPATALAVLTARAAAGWRGLPQVVADLIAVGVHEGLTADARAQPLPGVVADPIAVGVHEGGALADGADARRLLQCVPAISANQRVSA